MNRQFLNRSVRVFTLCLWLLLLSGQVNAASPLPAGHPRLRITAAAPAPVILHLGAVDHSILALQIEAQRTVRSAVKRYEPLPGDQTKVNRQHGVIKSVQLIRDGKPVAYLAGKDRKHAWFFVAQPLGVVGTVSRVFQPIESKHTGIG